MEYTTKIGDRPTQAHINYNCPCGCVAGLTYDRGQGAEHVGMCCCGRLLWVGDQAEDVVRSNFKEHRTYELDHGRVRLPWDEEVVAVLAIPQDALATEKAKRDAGKTPTKVVDPVCKMMFDPDTAAATSHYQGTTYYFCAVGCKQRFDANPKQYVASKGLLDRIRGR
jgi:YHS domain-containing protein